MCADSLFSRSNKDRPRTKYDGSYIFSLSTTWRGGRECTPSPSHNTSTGPMSFLGVTDFHPMLPLVPCPFWGGVPQAQAGGYSSPRWGVPWSRAGGTPWPGQDGGTPPPSQVRMGYPLGQVTLRTGYVHLLRFPRRRTVVNMCGLKANLSTKYQCCVMENSTAKM